MSKRMSNAGLRSQRGPPKVVTGPIRTVDVPSNRSLNKIRVRQRIRRRVPKLGRIGRSRSDGVVGCDASTGRQLSNES